MSEKQEKNIRGHLYRDYDGNQFYFSPFSSRIVQIPNDITFDQIPPEKGIFKFGFDPKEVRKKIESGLDTLVLEGSQNCNLRCSYCIYGGNYFGERNHRQVDMKLDIAEKAVKYFLNHSKDTPVRNVSFYGGEPFLNFGIIESIVRKYKEEGIKFSISTNGTLVSKYPSFLVGEDILLAISLDGDEELQDSRRGNGSFSKIMRGLEKISSLNPDFINRNVSFSITLDKCEQVIPSYRFFSSRFPNTPVRIGFAKCDDSKNPHLNGGFITKEDLLTLVQDYQIGIESGVVFPFLSTLFDGAMSNILFRSKGDKNEELLPIGFCPPGTRKLFVKPDGKFYSCEKLGYDNFEIGDVERGMNERKIFRLIESSSQKYSSAYCSRCWAARICDSCIPLNSTKAGTLNKDRFQKNCERKRKTISENLRIYTTLNTRLKEKFEKYLKELKGGL